MLDLLTVWCSIISVMTRAVFTTHTTHTQIITLAHSIVSPLTLNRIGGGIAVGSVLLVDEDEHRAYSDVLLKYFMSEGVAAGNELVVASGMVRPFSCIASFFSSKSLF